MVQGELFVENPSSIRESEKTVNAFFSKLHLSLSFDRLLIITICSVVLFVFTYAFGVERGKRHMERRLASLISTQSDTVVTAADSDSKEDRSKPSDLKLIKASDKAEVSASFVGPTAKKENQKGSPISDEAVSASQLFPVADLSRKSDYTVQLVTYKAKELAAREINRLKSSGHDGFVIPSGDYFQVCTNYFNNRGEAKAFLGRLRSSGRYPDAFVRSVVR